MSKEVIPVSRVAQAIRVLRGEKVLLDSDVALLYGVETRVLNQALKRNADRFPSDFMVQLNDKEMEQVSQFVTPSLQQPPGEDVSTSSQIVMRSRKHRGKRHWQLMTPPEKPRREIGFNVRENGLRYRARTRA
jgi:ORF6N domain-containing protein